MDSRVRQFLVYAALLLLPCFVLWTAISGALALPATGLVNLLLSNWFPDIVHGLMADGGNAVLMTEFGEKNGLAIPLDEAEYRLGFNLNTRILSYSLPFYTALHFATQRENYLGDYINGIVLLYALFIVGLTAVGLKELQVNLSTAFAAQEAFWVPGSNFVGIFFQFSVLIIPSLGPVALWLFQNRNSALLRELLPAIGTPAAK